MSDIAAISIPKFLYHLPVYRGFPVPFTVYYVDGKPDFRVNDAVKQRLCWNNTLCSVCGLKMQQGDFWFIGGPKSMQSGHFLDGPSHQRCAEFAINLCPYLNGTRTQYSDRPIEKAKPDTVLIHENVETVRPSKMGLRRARSYIMREKPTGGYFYEVQGWYGITRWF
jgi:hypothetical protein